jgi:hypothetical protein
MHRFSFVFLTLGACSLTQGTEPTNAAPATAAAPFVIPPRLDGKSIDLPFACDEAVARHCIDDNPFDLHDESAERHFAGHARIHLANAPPDDPSGAASRKFTLEAFDALPEGTSDAWATLEDFRTYHSFTVTESADAYAVSFLFAPGKEIVTVSQKAGSLSVAYQADVRTSHGDCERGLLMDKTASLACTAALP